MKSLASLLMLGLLIGCSSNDSAEEGSEVDKGSDAGNGSETENAAPASLPEVRYYLLSQA